MQFHYSEYKKREAEFNCFILQRMNCKEFTVWIDDLLVEHLNQIEYMREHTQLWLDSAGYPNKNEIVELAIKLREYEQKVDDLEDLVYRMVLNWNEKKQSLSTLKNAISGMKISIQDPYITKKKSMSSLERELTALKLLFTSKNGEEL